jgi:hypothetical protein
VFRSRRRPVVFPQHEHALLASLIAAAWNDDFGPLRLPRVPFVRGVALHDRGYDEHDADEIGRVSRDRWLAIQERGFAPTGEDAIVDLVVAMHVHRLVAPGEDDAGRQVLRGMDDAILDLARTAGVSVEDASVADRITNLCDRISFDACLEEPSSGGIEVLSAGGAPVCVRYRLDGRERIQLHPWPLDTMLVTGTIRGYAAEGYPEVLEPIPVPFVVEPAR